MKKKKLTLDYFLIKKVLFYHSCNEKTGWRSKAQENAWLLLLNLKPPKKHA